MIQRSLKVFGVLGLAAALLLAVVVLASRSETVNASASAQTESTTKREIIVSGTGRVSAPPDKATIQIGVQITTPTLAAATKQASETMTQVLDAIKAAGVSPDDIQTSTYSVNPIMNYKEGEPPTVTGYQVMNIVTVTVRDLANVGKALDAGMGAGANYLGGISFGIADSTALENDARTAAVKDATAIAQTLADAAGVKLGPVISITEGAVSATPIPFMEGRVMAADAASPGPVETGSMEIVKNVVMRFEIAQ